MADEKVIRIDVSNIKDSKTDAQDHLDKTTGKSTDNNSGNNTKANNELIKKTATTASLAIGYTAGKKIAKQVGTYMISNIGTKYGDQARQNEINNIKSAGSTLLSMGEEIAAGAMVAGPIGAVVASVAAIAGQVVEISERVDEYNQLQKQNSLEEVRSSERLGQISTQRNRQR